jgi:two-component system, sensor histidine kinase
LCGKQIPGVILTGETASECQHEVVSLGLGLAFKPITARQLSLTIEKYLEAAE